MEGDSSEWVLPEGSSEGDSSEGVSSEGDSSEADSSEVDSSEGHSSDVHSEVVIAVTVKVLLTFCSGWSKRPVNL